MLRLLAICCVFLFPGGASLAQDPVNGGMSAGELLKAGDEAFRNGEWGKASEWFLKFRKDFNGLPETKDAVARINPLLGICYVRMNRMEEALPLLEEGLKFPDLDPELRGDVLFFAGLAGLSSGKVEQARKYFGEVFQQSSLPKARRIEALVFGGTTYVSEKNWEEVAKFFAEHGETIERHDPAAASKLRVVVLHALMQEGKWEEAEKMAMTIRAEIDQVRQVVLFSSLMIALGDHFLEEGQSHQAIRMLRMVPSRGEILLLQRERLESLKHDLKRAVATKHPTRVTQLKASLSEIETSLAEFEKNTQFDSAARLRLASAYFQLERVREACLILDQMVRQMEPDAWLDESGKTQAVDPDGRHVCRALQASRRTTQFAGSSVSASPSSRRAVSARGGIGRLPRSGESVSRSGDCPSCRIHGGLQHPATGGLSESRTDARRATQGIGYNGRNVVPRDFLARDGALLRGRMGGLP